MALTKVSTAMFDTAAQSSDLNIDANTLFVDVSTNRVGIGTTSPSVPLEVSGQLKAGGITYPTSDGTNGQALVTNGSGVASFATVAPTAGTGVTVSGTTVSIGQAVATSSNVTFNNLVVSGTLTVNGATNTNSATNTTIEDILIELGTGTSGSPANDAGLVLERGSSDNVFIGWDESADTFTVGTGSFTGASSGNLTITPATAVFGGLTVDTSTLVVDASNNRVGIGNASPDVSLDVGSFTDAVHVPVGTTAQRPGSPAAGYFRYNSTLEKFEGYTTAWGEIGGGGSNTFTTNIYTGDGSTTAFTLSQSVSSVNDLIVFIDGVYQVPTAAYTVSGTTLTMTAAPANTRKIVAYSVKHMVSGSNINQNSFTGNGSAVAFTLATAPVNENNTQVFLDGVYQHKATYATSGTTLTFDTAPASGVAIEVMVFTQTEINVPVDGTITTVKLAADAVTSAKIADDAVGNDQLASGLTLGGNTTATIATAAQPNITSLGTLSTLAVNSGTSNISATFTSTDGLGGIQLADNSGNVELVANANNFEVRNAGGAAKLTIASTGAATFTGNIGLETSANPTITVLETGAGGVTVQGTGSGGRVYSNSGQSLLLGANGQNAHLAIASNGRVSIGDTSTSANNLRLVNASSTELDFVCSNGKNFRLQSTNASAFSIIDKDASNANRFHIDTNGKIGIGEASPDALLHVKHAGGGFDEVARLTAVANSAGDGAFLGFHGNSTTKFYGFIGGYDINTNQGGVKIGVGNGETAIADSMTKMTIDNTGITTFKPGLGDLSIKNNDGSGQKGIIIEGNDANHAIYFRRGRDGALNTMDFHEFSSFRFYTGGAIASQTEKVRINTNGQVLVGRQTDDVDTIGAMMDQNGIVYSSINETTFNTFLYRAAQSANAYRFYVNGSGQVSSTFTSISSLSDGRLKENVRDYTAGLNDILKLKPRVFDWKENEGKNIKNDVGFIAQEFEEVFPDWISNFLHDDLEDAKTVAASELIFPMVNAIKELKAEIDALKEKLNG